MIPSIIIATAFMALSSVQALVLPSGTTTFLQPPAGKIGTPVGLIFIQGASIQNKRYIDFATAIQNAVSFPLHVALPEFALDLALPFEADTVHANSVDAMTKITKYANVNSMKFFVGGHSLGATAAMNEANSSSSLYEGAMIFGASVLRPFNYSFPIPILSVNGEFDGLHRISRVGEAFYNLFDRKLKKDSNAYANGIIKNPIVVIDELTHLQMADGVNPPAAVSSLDFKPTIDIKIAHSRIASVVADFIAIHTGQDITGAALADLTGKVMTTRQFLDPMFDGFRLEAAPHIYDICDSDKPAPHCPWYAAWPPQPNRTMGPEHDCVCGTPWADVAVKIMAGLDETKYPIYHTDAQHDVTDTNPYHHAYIWNNCTAETLPCTVNTTTVSQIMYDTGDSLDSGFTHATAYEIRLKMKTRQLFALSTYDTNASFDLDGAESICAKVNQKAYEWGLSRVSAKALARFQQYGQKMIFGDDYYAPLPIGPLFIYNSLHTDDVKLDNGSWVLKVTAPSFKTPNTGFVTTLYPDSNAQHYCKLLSPARVIEWIHTDGLRKYMGWNGPDKTSSWSWI
ncbi:hypothetical protein HDU76_009960 [Blyttiomyces sp. JEL0837]|nr:hypothetical protein HDU76_009960 [Blyttiomyces sp. JEL0837]